MLVWATGAALVCLRDRMDPPDEGLKQEQTVISFSHSSFINVYLLITISIQNKLFCCENTVADHTLQTV